MMADNSWFDAAGSQSLAGAYVCHSQTLRGAIRHTLVLRRLISFFPPGRQRILDVGGGDGCEAIALARLGHEVVVLDADPGMLSRAEHAVACQPGDVSRRVRTLLGRGEETVALAGAGFDVVCCHGVLMYLDEPAAMLAELARATRPGGIISVLAKNGHALAMRPGLEQRWADVAPMLEKSEETGNLGVRSRGDTVEDLSRILARAGAPVMSWYGVRIFTDHLRDAPVPPDFDQVIEAEWLAGMRDPYREVARLIHLAAKRAIK
jgi:SAM-dependent methyltransferase